ncbi:replication-relaxation family protein [Patescibacteria group bacterium]|nr:replication-relaxation family protein [Patescibacteria group bacterium]
MTITTITHSITKQQLSILHHLLRFRFLTRIQIQTLLNHKHPGQINKWLKNLSDKHLIYKIYDKTFPDNTKPAVYCLDKKCITFLNQQNEIDSLLIKRIYKDKKRTKRFINHSIVIANLFIKVSEQFNDNNGKLYFYTKTDLFNYDFLLKPFPDIYVASEHNKETKRYFIEVLNSDIPRFVLRNRIKNYIEYYLSNQWQLNTSYSFPEIVFYCTNDLTIKFLDKFIEKTLISEGGPQINFLIVKELPLL